MSDASAGAQSVPICVLLDDLTQLTDEIECSTLSLDGRTFTVHTTSQVVRWLEGHIRAHERGEAWKPWGNHDEAVDGG